MDVALWTWHNGHDIMDMALMTSSIFRAVASKRGSATSDSETSSVACGSMSTVNETLKLDK